MTKGRKKAHLRKLKDGRVVPVSESSTGKNVAVTGIGHLKPSVAFKIQQMVQDEVRIAEGIQDILDMPWEELPDYIRSHVLGKNFIAKDEAESRSEDDAISDIGLSSFSARTDDYIKSMTDKGTVNWIMLDEFNPDFMDEETREIFESIVNHPRYEPGEVDISFAGETYRLPSDWDENGEVKRNPDGTVAMRMARPEAITEQRDIGLDRVSADFVGKLKDFRDLQVKNFDKSWRERMQHYTSNDYVQNLWETGEIDPDDLKDLPWDKIWE